MGLKISFKPSKNIKNPGIISPPKVINFHNWRAVIERFKEDSEGIQIITRDCSVIFLENLTFGKFIELNLEHETIKIPFFILKNSLSCNKCFGLGKTDWVQATRSSGVPTRHNRGYLFDFRDFRVADKKVSIVEYRGRTYILSRPNIKPEEEICHRCFGSGIFFKEKPKMITSIDLKKR